MEVSGFQAVTKKNDDSKEVFLKFVARSSGSFSAIEKWWKKWGQSPCLLIADGVLQATITEEDEADDPEAQPEDSAAEEKPKRKRKGKQSEMFSEEEKSKMAPVSVE